MILSSSPPSRARLFVNCLVVGNPPKIAQHTHRRRRRFVDSGVAGKADSISHIIACLISRPIIATNPRSRMMACIACC